ncbi:MAG: isopentenyl-diphosphate Delta-isomerase, partial [Eggerthellaceae bacterium]|nr:isopentenyl-diphosphate Delta-isomerase [Eggerthellaceae bacterium]
EIGSATKLRAHEEGLLHRAFSVGLVRPGDNAPELLLAKRALGKYHSGGLWANSCCSHPRAGEETVQAAYRRVREELGCEAAGLRDVAAFAYRAEFGNGLCEHEYDHVIVGRCEGKIAPDPTEVAEVRWVSFEALASELASEPGKFAAWAPMVLSMAMADQVGRGGQSVDERRLAS